VAFIGDENASRAPANLEWMEQRMPERRRFTQTTSLKIAFAKEATQLRKVPSLGVGRGLLVRNSCRAETASHTIEWLASGRKHLGEIN
jgi:hypothetical protein